MCYSIFVSQMGIQKRFSKSPEFPMLRLPSISDFSINRVSPHSIWIFSDSPNLSEMQGTLNGPLNKFHQNQALMRPQEISSISAGSAGIAIEDSRDPAFGAWAFIGRAQRSAAELAQPIWSPISPPNRPISVVINAFQLKNPGKQERFGDSNKICST